MPNYISGCYLGEYLSVDLYGNGGRCERTQRNSDDAVERPSASQGERGRSTILYDLVAAHRVSGMHFEDGGPFAERFPRLQEGAEHLHLADPAFFRVGHRKSKMPHVIQRGLLVRGTDGIRAHHEWMNHEAVAIDPETHLQLQCSRIGPAVHIEIRNGFGVLAKVRLAAGKDPNRTDLGGSRRLGRLR